MNLVRTMRPLLLGALFALAALYAAADEPRGPRAQPAQIAQWVQQLDDERFAVREIATEQLLAAGPDAIEPLVAAATVGGLEVVSRATHILRTLALESDPDPRTTDSATAALERLSAGKSPLAARRARLALAQVDVLREGKAMTELKALGAVIGPASVQIGEQVVWEVPTVEIGDDWRGGERGLHYLRWAAEIQQVVLVGEKVQESWLRPLARMPHLTYLKIKRTKLGDAALRPLAEVKTLQQLSLLYTPVTDRVAAELPALRGLTELRLWGTELTEEGAARAKAALPNANVDYKQGAFVGVGCDPTTPNCFVTRVIEKSAAEQAGLQPGDVIVSYGGDEVTNFFSLRELIQKHRAGQKVAVVVDRDGERIEKTLVLGEWE